MLGKKIGLAESVQTKIDDLKEVDILVGIPSFNSAKTIALIVLAIGTFLGNFLGRAALIASMNAGVRLYSLLSREAVQKRGGQGRGARRSQTPLARNHLSRLW